MINLLYYYLACNPPLTFDVAIERFNIDTNDCEGMRVFCKYFSIAKDERIHPRSMQALIEWERRHSEQVKDNWHALGINA
jgi:hypothetical protein